MSNPIKIRAHHLLCMQGFQGYGYSLDFAANMQQVIETINSPINPVVEIVAECDIIAPTVHTTWKRYAGKDQNLLRGLGTWTYGFWKNWV